MNNVKKFVPDWSGLFPELLEQIGRRLSVLEDFRAFRGACTTWRDAVTRKNNHRFMLPLLMLEENLKSHEREFYSLSKRKNLVRLPFLEAKGKKCLNVGFGWILTVSALGGTSSYCELSLVKPLYPSPKIQLPNYENGEKFGNLLFFKNALLLAYPSETTDFMLVLLVDHNIACWRNGDKEWTKINQTTSRPGNERMVYYKGCIYVMTWFGEIWKWDPNGTDSQSIMKVDTDGMTPTPFLVESTDGELLLIRSVYNRTTHETGYCRTERVDLENHCTTETAKGVGKDAVFVGDNSIAVAVDAADYPGVLRPNCIYFISNPWPQGYLGIYSVEDGSTTEIGSYSSNSQPTWIFPSF